MSDHNEPRRGVRFDPTVNLGHILTFAGFVAAGFGAYGLVDKRLTVLEVQAVRSMQDNAAQRDELKGVATQMREDVKELRRSVDELVRSTIRPKEDRR